MEYIQASKDIVEDRCVFCALLEEGDPDGERILRRESLVYTSSSCPRATSPTSRS